MTKSNPKHTDTSRSGDHNGPEQTFRDTERNLRDRIEADRAELVAEIVAWLLSDDARLDYEASASEEHFSWWAADHIEAKFGGGHETR